MCVSAAISAAAAHASPGAPKEREWRPPVPWSTTAQNACRSPGTRAEAASIRARTGVTPRVPMMDRLVISAPSQWVMSISS